MKTHRSLIWLSLLILVLVLMLSTAIFWTRATDSDGDLAANDNGVDPTTVTDGNAGTVDDTATNKTITVDNSVAKDGTKNADESFSSTSEITVADGVPFDIHRMKPGVKSLFYDWTIAGIGPDGMVAITNPSTPRVAFNSGDKNPNVLTFHTNHNSMLTDEVFLDPRKGDKITSGPEITGYGQILKENTIGTLIFYGDLELTNDCFVGKDGSIVSTINRVTCIANLFHGWTDITDDPQKEAQSFLTLGVVETGVFNQSGGVLNVPGILMDCRDTNVGVDTFSLTAGTVNIGENGIQNDKPNGSTPYQIELGEDAVGATDNWDSTLNMTLTDAKVGTTFNPNDNMTRFSDVLDGAGNLILRGADTLNLTGLNIFTGITTVKAELLRINNPSGLGTGDVFATDGTLGGNGRLAGEVMLDGRIVTSRDVDIRTLDLGGGLTYFVKAPQLDIELDFPDFGGKVTSNVLAIAGDLTLEGLLNNPTAGFGESAYQTTWTLITYTSNLLDIGLDFGTVSPLQPMLFY